MKIHANAAGGGFYTGYSVTDPSDAVGDENLAEPEGRTVASEEDVLIANAEEDGLPTHWLKPGSFAVGRVIGQDPDGKEIVEITNGTARTASPSTLGSSSEGSETADTHDWDRRIIAAGNDYGDTPVDMWITARVAYDETSAKTLYGFARKLSFDASGRLIAASAESRYTIDATEICT